MLNFQFTPWALEIERMFGDERAYVGAPGEERDLSRGKVSTGVRRI
jgi:hypothetical protein